MSLRLLCLNPNTRPGMTAAVARAIAPFLPEGTQIVETTGRIGAPCVATRASYAVAGHSALDALARAKDEPLDAVMLACFGDPALGALQENAAVPVIGMADASMMIAAREPGSFAVVTGGKPWEAMLGEFALLRGHSDRLCAVRATAATGGQMFDDPEAALGLLAEEVEACAREGASRVILGGAGLAGFAQRLRPRVSLPLVDCVEALAVATLEALAARKGPRPASPLTPEFIAASPDLFRQQV